jgi:hypothetical protein
MLRDYAFDNAEMARLFLSDPVKYAGCQYVWARLYAERHPDTWQVICPLCSSTLTVRDGRVGCACGYAARVEGLPV